MIVASHSTEHVIEEAVCGKGRRAWTDHFTVEERRQLMHEDLQAGRTVPRLMTSLIAAGVILATVTVVLVWKVL